MSTRASIWARQARARLISQMGGCCQHCGSVDDLELHCNPPQGRAHHRVGSIGRIIFYRRLYRIGGLVLLCAPCHLAKHLGCSS